MSKYRSRFEIIAEILSLVSEGARKTRIMYGANLSYELLTRYLSETLGAGLVRQNDNGLYEITDKGRMFLCRCNGYFEGGKHMKEKISYVENKRDRLEKLLCRKGRR